MQIPFVSGAYTARSTNIAADRCVNLYPEIAGTSDAKSAVALIGCPGSRLLATIGTSGAIRGAYAPSSGNAIVVRGSDVYRLSTAWVPTSVGTLLTSSGRVSIADNGTVACIVDGTYGYILNLATNAFEQITDTDFTAADIVDYIDGYFIFNRAGTQVFFISELLGTTFDALDFASAEGSPDLLVGHIVDHREVLMFGTYSTEVFYDSGNADFPIERQNTSIEIGCAAKFSPAKVDNSIVWLGISKQGGPMVWRMQGYTPVRISTHAVEFAIQGYSDVSDAFAYSYQAEGHSFYVLTFPTGNATWVYDVSTQLWHERAYRNPTSGALGRHRSNCHMYFGGEHVVGDYENGNIYALDLDCYTDNGDILPAIRAAGHVADSDYMFLYWHSMQVDIEAGVGLVTGQGIAPVIMLDWSDDGGHTWSNEKWASMGAIGKYSARAIWKRLGRSRDRIPRITITDPVKRVILGAQATLSKGGN